MKRKTKNIIAIVLFLFFALLMMLGIMSGESVVVFRHAVKICLECIGLG